MTPPEYQEPIPVEVHRSWHGACVWTYHETVVERMNRHPENVQQTEQDLQGQTDGELIPEFARCVRDPLPQFVVMITWGRLSLTRWPVTTLIWLVRGWLIAFTHLWLEQFALVNSESIDGQLLLLLTQNEQLRQPYCKLELGSHEK